MPTLYTPIDIEKVLQTYTFEEVLEYNELTEDEVLFFLVDKDFVTLPNPRPADVL